MSKRAEEIVTEHTKDFWDGEYDARERAALVAAIDQAFQEACEAVCQWCAADLPWNTGSIGTLHVDMRSGEPVLRLCRASGIHHLMRHGKDGAALAKTGERKEKPK